MANIGPWLILSSALAGAAWIVWQGRRRPRGSSNDVVTGRRLLGARRLVEAGTSFVLVSGAWGYFDHHGDNVRWGGIQKGLTPLLPRVRMG